MKKLLAALTLLLASASPVSATLFTIIFENGDHDWIGTYEPEPLFGGFTMDVLIGDCADPDHCTYDLNIGRADPLGSSPFHQTVITTAFGIIGRLDYFPLTRTWFTDNVLDSQHWRVSTVRRVIQKFWRN